MNLFWEGNFSFFGFAEEEHSKNSGTLVQI